jgi:hypothetical protein
VRTYAGELEANAAADSGDHCQPARIIVHTTPGPVTRSAEFTPQSSYSGAAGAGIRFAKHIQ